MTFLLVLSNDDLIGRAYLRLRRGRTGVAWTKRESRGGLRWSRIALAAGELRAKKEQLEKDVAAIMTKAQDRKKDLDALVRQGFVQVSREGWMYLGKMSDGKWKEKYLNLPDGTDPSSAKGHAITVKENVFLRTSPPKLPEYQFGGIKGVALEGVRLKVVEVVQTKPGIWWASVTR